MSDTDCLFCKIVRGEVPAELVHEDEHVLAFRDIDPKAPLHALVIPREHIASLDAAEERHGDVLARALLTAAEIARREGVAGDGYRTVINTGDDGGQSVHHLHVHVIGGRALGWPPG